MLSESIHQGENCLPQRFLWDVLFSKIGWSKGEPWPPCSGLWLLVLCPQKPGSGVHSFAVHYPMNNEKNRLRHDLCLRRQTLFDQLMGNLHAYICGVWLLGTCDCCLGFRPLQSGTWHLACSVLGHLQESWPGGVNKPFGQGTKCHGLSQYWFSTRTFCYVSFSGHQYFSALGRKPWSPGWALWIHSCMIHAPQCTQRSVKTIEKTLAKPGADHCIAMKF